jgi:molybdopterin synthase catalytic subunit
MTQSSTITVHVLYFAIMRDLLNKNQETLHLPQGTVVGDLFPLVTRDQPRLAALQRSVMVMVNEAYAKHDRQLQDGDEIAFIPPVSGGDHPAPRLFRVTADELDPRDVESLVAGNDAGAIVTFTGTVRDNARERDVTGLDYEAYVPAAEKMLAQIGAEVADQWPGVRIAITHRTGYLVPGVASVVIACASSHREAAFEACAFAIHRIKEIVPIWKKEHYADGAVWIGSELDYQIETGRIEAPSAEENNTIRP